MPLPLQSNRDPREVVPSFASMMAYADPLGFDYATSERLWSESLRLHRVEAPGPV